MNLSRQQLLIALCVILAALSVYLYITRKSGVLPIATTLNIASTTETTPEANADDTVPGGEGTQSTHSGAGASATTPALTGKLAPELVRPGGFSNSDPFQLKDFYGQKVVLP